MAPQSSFVSFPPIFEEEERKDSGFFESVTDQHRGDMGGPIKSETDDNQSPRSTNEGLLELKPRTSFLKSGCSWLELTAPAPLAERKVVSLEKSNDRKYEQGSWLVLDPSTDDDRTTFRIQCMWTVINSTVPSVIEDIGVDVGSSVDLEEKNGGWFKLT